MPIGMRPPLGGMKPPMRGRPGMGGGVPGRGVMPSPGMARPMGGGMVKSAIKSKLGGMGRSRGK